MTKKAQNVGQVFIYTLTIVVVAVILLFGYNAIMNFREKTDQVALIDFQRNVESSIETISSQYGTLRNKDFDLSSDYSQVCFVRNYDLSVYTDPACSPINLESILAGYPVILDSFDISDPSAGPLKNIFLVKSGKQVAESFDIGKVRFTQDCEVFRCFDVTHSRLSIKIEGKGNHVIIS